MAQTIDAAAPNAPSVLPSNGTTISGTGEPGATMTVVFDTPPQTLTSTVGSDGAYSITPTTRIPDGTVISVQFPKRSLWILTVMMFDGLEL